MISLSVLEVSCWNKSITEESSTETRVFLENVENSDLKEK